MKNIFIGIQGIANEIIDIFIGNENNKAVKIEKIFLGNEDNKAIKIWENKVLVEIPTMTSNTTPLGIASASSIYSSSVPAWKAFDKDSSTRWESVNYQSDTTRKVTYDFGFEIQPIEIYVKNYTSNTAYAFKIEASKDDSTWDVLVDQSSNKAVVDKTYIIDTNETYRYFRYRCTNGSGTYRAGVYEMNVKGYRYF